jgi:hypothetical protein
MTLTIHQALKRIKQIDRKVERHLDRLRKWCSYFDNEEPAYSEEDIRKMHQSVSDLLAEKVRIRHAMHVVNATHKVEWRGMEITVDELLLAANVRFPRRLDALKIMHRKEKNYNTPKEVQVVNNFDPNERDKMIDALEDCISEINDVIDAANIQLTLEV